MIIATEDVSKLLRHDGSEATPEAAQAARAIERALDDLGLSLRPLHARTADRTLSTYFQVETQDRAAGDRVAGVLAGRRGIRSVYWKPAEEAP